MTSLTNVEIAERVQILSKSIIEDMKPTDKPAIDALTEVVTNLLQNLNTIAAAQEKFL